MNRALRLQIGVLLAVGMGFVLSTWSLGRADTQQAGPGDTVFMEDGREATYTLPVQFVPVEAAVVGIVDLVDVVE